MNYIYFLKKILLDMCPFMGPLIPLFWTTGDLSSGFQLQSGQSYLRLAEAYVMYIPVAPERLSYRTSSSLEFQFWTHLINKSDVSFLSDPLVASSSEFSMNTRYDRECLQTFLRLSFNPQVPWMSLMPTEDVMNWIN